SRWATAETSFKYHAACRHTHPAADALLAVVQAQRLAPRDIAKVVAHVHQGAIDVLGAVVTPRTVHQAKFNMGTVLGLVAHHGYAGVTEFEQGFDADSIAAFRDRVEMVFDEEVDAAYPARWIGKVTVTTTDGRMFKGRVDEPKGDPGNTLSRDEIATKLHRLAAFSGAATEGEAARLLGNAWRIASEAHVGSVFEAQPRVESAATVAA
ncbi:MAG TPA: MmgE/PrpD family protein, partial [Paraburkholderia sp.]|nr:MmgE/PrpD family protein [Paraburkholderia sp.]